MSERFYSNPGYPFRDVKESYYDDKGALCLRVVSRDNTDDLIQSYAGSGDIVSLARRCMLGDPGAVRDDVPMFVDNVGAPKSAIDYLNLVTKMRGVFDSLSIDHRKKFDNDFNVFFAQLFDKYTESPDSGLVDAGKSTPGVPSKSIDSVGDENV